MAIVASAVLIRRLASIDCSTSYHFRSSLNRSEHCHLSIDIGLVVDCSLSASPRWLVRALLVEQNQTHIHPEHTPKALVDCLGSQQSGLQSVYSVGFHGQCPMRIH